MAGSMRKMAVYLGLVEDDVDIDYADEYDDEPQSRTDDRYRAEPRAHVETRPARTVDVRPARELHDTSVQAPVRPRPAPQVDMTELNRISTLLPRSYNDARQIGEEFRGGTPVIMNLTEMDDADARRIVDFGAGLVFALEGSIQRITNKVFLLSPINVDVAAAAREQLREGGFFNQS